MGKVYKAPGELEALTVAAGAEISSTQTRHLRYCGRRQEEARRKVRRVIDPDHV
jgi:hypothetical protein